MSADPTVHPRQRRTGVSRLLPLLGWWPDYTARVLRADLFAGLTVGVMLVPQAMAYASLAGMPPAAGLYAAVVPVVVYALLGSSATLAVGPVAIISLMAAATLAPLADGDPNRYAALAAVLALMVGALQLLMGLLRLGAVVNFLSHPVLSGFTSAAAIVIAASQVADLLGLDAERSKTLPEAVTEATAALATAHGPTIAVAAGSVLALVLLKRFLPRVPGALVVVAGVTALSTVLVLRENGVAVLGHVPGGLPAPSLPDINVGDLVALAPSALAIALVGYLEGIAVAKSLAARVRRTVSPDGELVAVGGANLTAGLFGAFPVAGGFSRSAVNFSAGARTPVASLITAAVVALTALFLTPLFHDLPKAVLAAIIVVAVASLVDVRGALRTWRTRRSDGLALTATFLVTLLAGVEAGIGAGVAFSLAAFLWHTSRPHIAELGMEPDTGVFLNLTRYQGLRRTPGVKILRVDAPLYFANAERVKDALLKAAQGEGVQTLVLDASGIGACDSDCAHALADLDRALTARGVVLRVATVRGPVRDVLARDGLWARWYEHERIHPDTASAVSASVTDTEHTRTQDLP